MGEVACSYDYDGLLNMTVRAYVENEYGEVRERDAEIFLDKNPKTIQTAWIPVGKETDCVELSVSRGDLYEPGLSYIDFASMPLSFTGFEAVTEAAVNPFRLCFFWCAAGTVIFLIVCRSWIGRHAEAGFLVLALTGGLLLSLSLPAQEESSSKSRASKSSVRQESWFPGFCSASSRSRSAPQTFPPS